MEKELNTLLHQYMAAIPWRPQDGPQWSAFHSPADVTLYGGSAGGGKTSLAVGLALTLHRETLFIRREAKQLAGVLDHIAELIDPERIGYSSQTGEWKIPAWDGNKRKIVLGSTKNLGDEQKFQGRPKDLLVIDEAANMHERAVRFLMGWVRTTAPNQRTRTLLCSNPPTSSEGMWLVEMFAPWLDPEHPNPAAPGELRYRTTIGGKDIDCPSGEPFLHGEELVYPKSYTFIPAKVSDNRYLGTDYLRELQALPEPLRSQMLYGDFTAGRDDDAYQVIPSEWVKQAQARWVERELVGHKVTSVGVDPSRGGRDETVIAMREGWHYHRLRRHPGHEMSTGNDVANEVMKLVAHSHAPIHTDVIGIGASVVDSLDMFIPGRVVPCNAAEKAEGLDASGSIKFANKRAQLWWNMRDMLDPAYGQKVELPPDSVLLTELCSPRYKLMPSGIQVEKKEDIVRRIGRSTDSADAVIMAAERGQPMHIQGIQRNRHRVTGGITQW